MPDGVEVSVLELLVSSVVDYAIFALDPDGNVVTWNGGAERLKGYKADEIIGRHFSAFYTAEDQRAGLPATGLAHAAAEGRWENEGWRVRKDGTRFWADVVITALRGEDGQIRGFAKITRDLTERKRNEDALRGVLEREREVAEQLRGVDQMRRELVAMIAHDLRGPVSVVLNILDLLLDQWDELDDAARRARVERSLARAGSLAALTDDIFDLAMIDAGALEVVAAPTEVTEIVRDTVEDLRTARPDSCPIAIVTSGPAWALGDARRIRQVLDNLVSNAVKFSTGASAVEVAVLTSGQEVCITVHNTGPAIAPADQERIFDRFVRLVRAEPAAGSGLGLFIARSLVEAQGGRITVESSEGAGTTFTVALPAAGG